MRINRTIKSYLLFCFLLVPRITFAQISDAEIEELRKQSLLPDKKPYEIVSVQEQDGRMTITYNLQGNPDDEFDISLVFLRERDAMFQVIPQSVVGNIGTGKFAGTGNKIVWDYKADYQQEIKGDDFYFILGVKKIEPTNIPWTWIGVGGVVAAGGAAVLLLGGTKEEATTVPDVPGISISRPN